eukprot:TRINITY_DN10389_c0_g1_i2.p1 TRINITY_DN10389_c0_g1~~TRINITY_DN10389_c0_g1_i2.p1  ORF type:complete len:133 (+),score=18.62 TRINITY_DN10389_c0_g1_i2:298-696(+)
MRLCLVTMNAWFTLLAENAMLLWKEWVLALKAARTIEGIGSEKLARTVRTAIHKTGPETVRQVLVRWLDSVQYAKSQRAEDRPSVKSKQQSEQHHAQKPARIEILPAVHPLILSPQTCPQLLPAVPGGLFSP